MKKLLLLGFLITSFCFVNFVAASDWWDSDWKRCRGIYFEDPLETDVNREYEVVEVVVEDSDLNEDCRDLRIVDKYCNGGGNEVKYVLIESQPGICKVRFEVNKNDDVGSMWYSAYYDNPSAESPQYLGLDNKPYYVFGDNFERNELGDNWEIIQEFGVIEIQDGYLRLYTSSSGEDWSHNILKTAKGDFSKSSVNYRFAIGYQGRTDNFFLAQVFSSGKNWLYDGDSLYEDEAQCGATYPFSFVKWVGNTEIKMLDTRIMYNNLGEWHNVERTMMDDTYVNFGIDGTNHGDFEIPDEGNWVRNSYFLIQHGTCIFAQASSEVHYDNICIVNENHACNKPDVGLELVVGEEIERPLSCGDTIIEDTILNADMECADTHGIVIGADGITLDCNGHSITGNKNGGGIYIDGHDNVIIKNCIIDSFYFGISFYDVNGGEITDNIVTNNGFLGIHIWRSSNNRISNNNINENILGIDLLQTSSNNFISNNNINNNHAGIFVDCGYGFDRSSFNTISSNYIAKNKIGIKLNRNTWNNIISKNIITSNDEYGIHLWEDSVKYTTIFNNEISYNGLITEKEGLYIESSQNNSIYNNNFFDNFIQARDDSILQAVNTYNNWNIDECPGGNFWSDYDGIDSYEIDGRAENMDKFPYLVFNGWDLDYNEIPDCKEDSDSDGVLNVDDLCPDTVLPETPSGLIKNHYSDIDGDNIFETATVDGISDSEYSLTDTFGCSCQQILDIKPGKNLGETMFGCNADTMDIWIEQINWASQ